MTAPEIDMTSSKHFDSAQVRPKLSISTSAIARFSLALLITIIYIFPLYWMFITSIKPPEQIFQTPPSLFPKQIQIDSYKDVLGLRQAESTGAAAQLQIGIDGMTYLINSLIIAGSTTVLTLLLAVPGAYALARFNFRGRSLYLLFLLMTQMLPGVLLVIPLFVLFKPFGLINRHLGVILADTALALPFAIIILRTSFLQIPVDLEEAAFIDGSSPLQMLWHIMIPLMRSGIIAVGVFTFLVAWGEFVFALSFLQDKALHPISIGIFQFIGMYKTQWNAMMAFAVLAALPTLIAFIFLQRYFINGVTTGAVK